MNKQTKMLNTLMIKKKKYYKLRAYLLGKLLSSHLIYPTKPKFHFWWQRWCRKFPPHLTSALSCPCRPCQSVTALSAGTLKAGLVNRSGLKEPLCYPWHFSIWITAIGPCGPTAAEAGPGEGQHRQGGAGRLLAAPPCHWEGFAILYFP